MLYKYDKVNLQYRKVSIKQYIYWIVGFFLLFSGLGFTASTVINKQIDKIPVIIRLQNEEPTPENIKNYIKTLNIAHFDIVYAQVLLETGNYTSPIYKNNRNLFGMKISYNRPSTAIKEELGHAFYQDWKQSIIDYSLWQSAYARGLSDDEYYQLLDNLYCRENPDYSKRLKQLIK